jgi:hypothetical protein
MDRVAQFHVAIRPRRAIFIEAIEAGSADPAQFHHPFNDQPPVGLHFFLDLPVDRGFPVSACSIRCSSMRCKHPAATGAARWGLPPTPAPLRPSIPLAPPPHRGQFELFGELPKRQSHDSILHLNEF